MIRHAKTSSLGRIRCAASHHDQGDREPEDIDKRQGSRRGPRSLARALSGTHEKGMTWTELPRGSVGIYGIEPSEIMFKGKQPRKVKARGLFCFWAVSELGMSISQVARRLEMSAPGVGFSVERGPAIAHENEYHLIDRVSYYSTMVPLPTWRFWPRFGMVSIHGSQNQVVF